MRWNPAQNMPELHLIKMWIHDNFVRNSTFNIHQLCADFDFAFPFSFFRSAFSICASSRVAPVNTLMPLQAMDFSELKTIDEVMNEFSVRGTTCILLLRLFNFDFNDELPIYCLNQIHLHLAKRLKFYYWKVQRHDDAANYHYSDLWERRLLMRT